MNANRNGKKNGIRIAGDIRRMPTMLEPIPMPGAGGRTAAGKKAEAAAMPPLVEPIPMPDISRDTPEK